MIYKDEKPAILVLDDGSYYEGIGFGAIKKITGQITFNTIPGSGYIELLTNPINRNKIIVCTYPSIGNYGVPEKDLDEYGLVRHFESDQIHVKGLVVSEYCDTPSHHESVKTLDEWFIEEDIPAIQWVDTRKLTQYLVKHRTTMGILQVFNKNKRPDISELKKEAQNLQGKEEELLIPSVSTQNIKEYSCKNNKGTVVVIDLGVKNSIPRLLLKRERELMIVPYDTSYEKILNLHPNGILVSDGPGDPRQYLEIVSVIKALMKTDIPMMGIGLGHLLIGLAAGGEVYKMKAPHRGGRTTVQNSTDQCFITYQNHGYCLRNLQENGFLETFHDKDDTSNEGLIHNDKLIISVLFNPEGAPGPLDLRENIFNKFLNLMEGSK
jgi:carbamoyl-phosphate synthase small subunit